MNKPFTSTYDVLRQHGVDRRDFIRFCVTTAAAMGLEASVVSRKGDIRNDEWIS